MFGKTVLGIDGEHFEDALDAAKQAKGTHQRPRPRRRRPARAGRDVQGDRASSTPGAPSRRTRASRWTWPSAPSSTPGTPTAAKLYRRQERIPADLGTAVNICSMVFGNLGMDSGTGVAFTRDPATGAQGVYGDYLQNAQGEDVVAGIRNTVPLAELEQIDKKSYDELTGIMATLEEHYRDLCDIEFTIERGKLWMLQTRVGKRTAAAAFRIATQLVDEGLIDMDEAVDAGHRRAAGAADVPALRRATAERKQLIAKGMNASPGAAVGKVVFDSYTAVEVVALGREGHPGPPRDQPRRPQRHDRRAGHPDQPRRQDLARRRRRPRHGQDLRLRRRGARRRHQAPPADRARTASVVHEGDVISIDGTTGEVFLGEVPVVDSPVVRVLRGRLDADSPTADDLVKAVDRIMTLRRRRAPDVGAGQRRHRRGRRPRPPVRRAGHRPVPHRAHVPRRAARAGRAADPGRHRRRARGGSSSELLPLQREDFVGILEAMDGLPVTDPAARPAAARVPARHHRAVGARGGGRGPGRGARGRPAHAAGRAQAARAEPDARPARRAARAWSSRACSRCRSRAILEAAAAAASRPAACRGSRSWCRWSANVQEFETDQATTSSQVAREVAGRDRRRTWSS